ncbi:hypothetical protein LOD99_6529 [Oopsacas minuta]|uniref:non-specific serine/threonine protein kinase n=1 Tax=Oopsacas minuta TaxID=111878 RepID=A0AAV7JLG5_9METZ|nr:hypothetical protein LOD99_6529 [Oopsacas minuta]
MSLGDRKYFEPRDDDNLTGLAELTTETILQAVKNRYLDDKIYTHIGEILISVNPFKSLPIYSQDIGILCNQIVQNPVAGGQLVPHIFNVACKLYHTMYHTKKQQVCVISGESGAGKTESAKFVIHQIVNECIASGANAATLSHKILMVNPILEAFGNAQTLFNDNSSRFGKYIELTFDTNRVVTGAKMAQYLLEKSRITFQAVGERNFHVFYYLLAGIAKSKRKELFSEIPKSYNFIYLSNYRFSDNDFTLTESLANFHVLCDCLDAIGFEKGEIIDIFRVLELVLHIGNVSFSKSDQAEVKNLTQINILSELLGIEPSHIIQALTVSVNTARNETITIPYNSRKALDVRDATAKALYERTFAWIVYRINESLSPSPQHNINQIGILDIFGFECFQRNGFEQFCINLANEQLQHYFNQYIFSMELDEYQKEGLGGIEVSFKDNSNIINLFLNRPYGLISLLDEQTRFPKGNDSGLLQKCKENITRNKAFIADLGDEPFFTIKHYAGNVRYTLTGFIEINRDTLPNNIITLLQQSPCQLISHIFTSNPSEVDPNTLLAPSRRGSRLSMRRGLSGIRGGGSVRRTWGAANDSTNSIAVKAKPNSKTSVAGQFRKSLEWLMAKLCSANPHFIRCIKPNPNKLPNTFQNDFVANQLSYTGTLETVRVRREGYSYRPLFSEFVDIYSSIAYPFLEKIKPNANVCLKILAKVGLTEFKIGRSKIFLKYFHQDHLNRVLINMNKHAITLQKHYRGYITRKQLKGIYTERSKQEVQLTIFLNSIMNTSPFILQRQRTMIEEDEARKMSRMLALEPALEPEVTQEDINFAEGIKHTVLPILSKKELKKLTKKQKKANKTAKKSCSVPKKSEKIVEPKPKLSHNTLQPYMKEMPHGEVNKEQMFIAVDPDYLDIFHQPSQSADELSDSTSESDFYLSVMIPPTAAGNIPNPRVVHIGQVTTFDDDYIPILSPHDNSIVTNMSEDLYGNEPQFCRSELLINDITVNDRFYHSEVPTSTHEEAIYSNVIPKNKVSNLINKYEIVPPIKPGIPPKSTHVRAMAINTSPEQREVIEERVITALAREQSLRRWRNKEIKTMREDNQPAVWFHGMIPRDVAENILLPLENGSFLVRQSENRLGYALSVGFNREVHHYMVETLPGGRYRLKGSQIEHVNLHELIWYYTHHIISERFREKLYKPVPKMEVIVTETKKTPKYVKIKDLFKRKKK